MISNFAFFKFELYKLPFQLACTIGLGVGSAPAPGTTNWQKEVLTADYIVDNIGIVPGDDSKGLLENISDQLKEGFKKYKNQFEKIGEIKANGFDIDIYKRIKT